MFAYCGNNPVCRKDTQGTEDTESYWNDGSNGDAYNEPIDPNDMAPSTPTQAPVGQSYGSTGGGVNSSTSGVAQSNSNSQNGSSNLGQGKSASSSNLDSPVSPRQVSKGALKNVDVHAFKKEFVKNDGSSWDLYKDTAHNAAIWLGNKSQTVWIPTGYVLEQLIEFFRKGGNSMDTANTVREIPTIQCILSISFPDEETARNFAAEIDLLTGKSSRVFKPRISNEWIVDAVCMRDKSWDLDEVVSKLFDSINNVKNQIKELIVQYRGEVVIDIAVYETDTYPALVFSQETIRNICFFSASVGIDLV